MEALLAADKATSRELISCLFQEFGSLTEALAASSGRVARVVGKEPAKRLRNLRSLVDAVLLERVRSRPWISVEEMARFLNFEIGYSPIELFYAFYLDAAGAVIHSEVVAKGTTTATLVDARQVIVRAVECGATSLVVAHNHPSGIARPSTADIQLTVQLERMAGDFEMRMIDHLIVARGKVCSMKRKSMVDCGQSTQGRHSGAAA